MILPILETACALQLHSLGPVITQPKPKSDDVISPNNSPFAEPVIIVYTFPCQSAGVPPLFFFLFFFSPIGSCCCDRLLETNILS